MYQSLLTIKQTQIAIKLVKDTFEEKLAKHLSLIRVSAPLFVDPNTGLNDNLSGKEKAVSFIVQENKKELEIVQSLAKWKRYCLKKYNFTGIYTDMNAIRPYEKLDNIHSLYVDQWDYEKVISKEDRNEIYLKKTVIEIYKALKETAEVVNNTYPILKIDLPKDIHFITSEELLSLYPTLNAKERENMITKKYKAVFLMHIGNKLENGYPHDDRAADYDDWSLNGDILLYNEVLSSSFEISSMGIRVNKESLLKQLKIKNEEYKLNYEFHKSIIDDQLPLTLGGGIGQSRICMFMLKKMHIGEVQASYWPEEEINYWKKQNVELL